MGAKCAHALSAWDPAREVVGRIAVPDIDWGK